MKKMFRAHHRTEKKERPGHLAKVVRTATRKRVRPNLVAYGPVKPSPLPCALQLFAFGSKYLTTIVLK